ncbi:hypothetical protein V6N13_005617 [Hibiscus sabdariffa]
MFVGERLPINLYGGTFGTVIWRLYLHRNQLLFDSNNIDVRPVSILSRILRDDMVRVIVAATTRNSHAIVDTHDVHWCPPPFGW